jgi:hypothetical protein
MRAHDVYALVLPSLALCACVHSRAATGPIVTDRPDQTEGTQLVPPGWTQLEAGMTAYKPGLGKSYQTVGEALIRVLAAPRLEARLGIPSVITTSGADRELSDGGLEIKTPLLLPTKEASRAVPALSLLASTSISTHWSREPVFGTPQLILAASWSLSERADLASNIVALPFASQASDRLHGITLSAGFDFTDRFGSYAEVYNLGEPTANGGVTYRVTPNFQVDARAGVTGFTWPRKRGSFVGVGFGTRW